MQSLLLSFLMGRISRRDPDNDGRIEAEPGPRDGYGASPATAVVEAYKKERPESSVPSTASSDMSRLSGFSGQGGGPYTAPPQEFAQPPQVGQGLYFTPQYQGMPVGQPYQQPYVMPAMPVQTCHIQPHYPIPN